MAKSNLRKLTVTETELYMIAEAMKLYTTEVEATNVQPNSIITKQYMLQMISELNNKINSIR